MRIILLLWCISIQVYGTPSHPRFDTLSPHAQHDAEEAHQRLHQAIKNPEYTLDHWVALPTAPHVKPHHLLHLSLKEAILLALRYNPNIQNAELDRIIQRYRLRVAYREFELQYALAGNTVFEKSRYSHAGHATTRSYVATPEFNLKTPLGTQASLKMDNTIAAIGNYNPLLTLSVTQPLLRGFGITINQAALKDAIATEELNRINT